MERAARRSGTIVSRDMHGAHICHRWHPWRKRHKKRHCQALGADLLTECPTSGQKYRTDAQPGRSELLGVGLLRLWALLARGFATGLTPGQICQDPRTARQVARRITAQVRTRGRRVTKRSSPDGAKESSTVAAFAATTEPSAFSVRRASAASDVAHPSLEQQSFRVTTQSAPEARSGARWSARA